MDCLNDKLSIKNLLFTKAIPNYSVPIPTNGHKLFSCTDCGDKFILESSYDYHIRRKSMQISYQCVHCNDLKIFFNRCNFLAHIRSHAFKTATINVIDLKVEPLPSAHFSAEMMKRVKNNITNNSYNVASPSNIANNSYNVVSPSNIAVSATSICFECKSDVNSTGVAFKDRAKHYMQLTNETYSCPVCMFVLPTMCALKSHLRVHLRVPPYYCPECGIQLPPKSANYPYNHDCEGFKMMRVTARLKCPKDGCPLFHPTSYQEHLKEIHFKKVFKCPYCFVACFTEAIMLKHLKGHRSDIKHASLYYQCDLCPSKLILQSQIEAHLKVHSTDFMYPCWKCGKILPNVPQLLHHQKDVHGLTDEIFNSRSLPPEKATDNKKNRKARKYFRVVKRCDQCKRSFTYKCRYGEIGRLPKECPYKCSVKNNSTSSEAQNVVSSSQLTCHLCKNKISQDWNLIKEHYALHHKSYRCLDLKVLVERANFSRLDKRKNFKKHGTNKKKSKGTKNQTPVVPEFVNIECTPTIFKGLSEFACTKCCEEFDDKDSFEKHMISHRDPCMAYQCLECGDSFVVKPSFSTHLLLEHGISDVEEYISKKQCYNEHALNKYQYQPMNNEPLRENQCNICRDQFNQPEELEKHFRVHGMAFLMKNNSIKNNSP